MADPTDEILRALATRSGEARLVADRGRVGFAVGDRCLTIDHIAAELLQLREALRAADGLAEHSEHTLTDGERECRMCRAYLPPIALSTPSAAPMPHKPGCPLGKYLAARGER